MSYNQKVMRQNSHLDIVDPESMLLATVLYLLEHYKIDTLAGHGGTRL